MMRSPATLRVAADDGGVDVAGAALGFEEEFGRLWRVAMRAAHRLLGDRESAEDVAAEALARTYERWDRLVANGDPAPWVARVAANLAIDRARRLVRHPGVALGSAASAEVADPHLAERVTLAAALRSLPTRQREAVVLRYLCDVSEAETARLMDCTAGTVKQHASRGLTHLRTALQPMELR
jgi:RNA polymerase sigma-70 factor (sigma-E family)